MADVLVPSIFITRNYTHIEDYFLNGNRSVDDLPQDNDSFLICGKTNNYLESFDLSYNMGSTKQQVLTLTFIDTDGNFEDKFFIKPFNLLKELFQKDIEKDTSTSSVKRANLVSLFDTADTGHKLYVSFGVGNHTQSWSSPLAYTMVKANVDLSPKGVKRYTFKYTPSDSVLFRPRIQFNLDNPNPEREFMFFDSLDILKITTPTDNYTNNNFENTEVPNVSPSHVIYNLLKKYVSVIAPVDIDNIIVILPKIEIFTKEIEEILSYPGKQEEKLKEYFSTSANLGNSFGISVESLSESIDSLIETYKTQRANRSLPVDVMKAVIENSQNLAKKPKYFYTISSKPLESSICPSIPNWFYPLNKISAAYQTILKTADELVLWEENDLKILAFWHEMRLIKNPKEKCIVIGLEKLITEWLYKNQIPGESPSQGQGNLLEEMATGFKPDFDLIECKERTILSDPAYILYYLNTVSKKQIGSSFGEKISFDELALENPLSESGKALALISRQQSILELFDIPIFTHNLPNPNVLDINVDNSEVYINATRKAIRDNFEKFFLSQVTQSSELINLVGFNPSSLIQIISESLEIGDFFGMYSPVNSSNLLREKLKNVLLQQFFILGKDKIEINQNADLIEQLSKIPDHYNYGFYDYPEWDPTKESDEVYRRRYIIEMQEYYRKQFIKISDDELRKRIKKITGLPNAYTEAEVKEILDAAKPLLKTFSNLIIKNQGDVDFKLLIIAQNLRMPSVYNKIGGNLREIIIKEQGGDFFSNNLSLEFQQKMYQVALLLCSLYTIDLPDKENKVGMMFKPNVFGYSTENIAAEIFKYQTMNAYSVTIKTLPFFHLCNYRTMALKPSFLFSQKINSLSNNINSKTLQLDIFSGQYNIEGFKHFISTRDCYSEFLLKKRTLGAIT